MATLAEIIDTIHDLSEDVTLPKNIKAKFLEIIQILESEEDELSLRVNKALHEIDDIASDVNMQSFIRTQLLGIASALETVE